MFRFFKKLRVPFFDWVRINETMSPFIPQRGIVGDASLGDSTEKIRDLGQPERFDRLASRTYLLEYPDLHFEIEDGVITYIACLFGKVEVILDTGRSLQRGMSVAQTVDALGSPDDQDDSDIDDVILFYKRGNLIIECEFGERQELIRINCFRNQST